MTVAWPQFTAYGVCPGVPSGRAPATLAVASWLAFVWAGPSFDPHDASFRKYDWAAARAAASAAFTS